MFHALTLTANDPATLHQAFARLRSAVESAGAAFEEEITLSETASDLRLAAADPDGVKAAVDAALSDLPVDFCVQPWDGRRKRLLIADMDSTIIGCECLDELADFAGVKAQVSEITERAMRGEIGFEGALRERVAMLKGLPISALAECYQDRVRLNPGAQTLVKTMAGHGARCLLVSGGFRYFTSRVAEACGFDEDRANTLIEADGVLTGAVGEPILGREAKLAALLEEAARLGLDPAQTLAVGDGANDLAMIEAAGLGVAYRAKPVVAAQAHARVDHTDLTSLLYFQGYAAQDFRR
jgi:phosphoserine phosphatase